MRVVVLGVLLVAGCLAPAAPPPAGPGAATEEPAAGVPAAVLGLSLVASLAHPLVNDLAFRPGWVYGASHTGGAIIVNVSDPESPTLAAVVPCNGIDVGVVDLPSGRRIMTLSHSGDDGCPDAAPGGGIRLVDVTDPEEPVVLGQAKVEGGSHAHTTWGDTGLVLNSQVGQLPVSQSLLQVVDITDPEAPTIVARRGAPLLSGSTGCHDIFAEPERSRAVCAATTESVIWDMTDPLAPKVVSTIRNPRMQVHHWAATAHNGTLLVISDESGGFAGPACTPPAPVGALWAYDITDPAAPKELGYFVPPRGLGPAVCTAHYFDFIGDGPLLVGGFYTAGTVVVDFTDPTEPQLVDQQIPPGANTWSSYWNPYDGYVYAGDWGRGLDVFEVG